MSYLIIFLLSLFSFPKEKTTIVVAKDGSGQFTTIQAAIESVKDSVAAYSTIIFIKKGEYREKVFLSKNGLILRGKNGAVGSTIICLTPLIHSDYLYYFLINVFYIIL